MSQNPVEISSELSCQHNDKQLLLNGVGLLLTARSSKYRTAINSVTFINCATAAVLSRIHRKLNKEDKKELYKHPFIHSFLNVIYAMIYGIIGVLISNIGYSYSGEVIVNGTMFWHNYNLIKTIWFK